MLLLSNCSSIIPPDTVRSVFNHPVVMSCLIWAVVVLVLGYWFYRYFRDKVNKKYQEAEKLRLHEKDMKELAFEQEKYWHSITEQDKDKDLDRKMKEFEELTIHQKLLDKVLDKKLDDKIQDMGKELDALKKQFESLNGEIEQIIIKKKE